MGKKPPKIFACQYNFRSVAAEQYPISSLKHAEYQVEISKKLPKHQNLLEILYAEKTKTEIYIAFEIFEYTLYDCVHRNFLPGIISKKQIVTQILQGLSVVHKYHFHHGNITASNVLLKYIDRNEVIIKLSDFSSDPNKMVRIYRIQRRIIYCEDIENLSTYYFSDSEGRSYCLKKLSDLYHD